jgi:hypothetical protein
MRKFMSFAPWVRVVIYAAAGLLVVGLLVNGVSSLRNAIFGNPEVKREQGRTVVAQEQGKAEATIADKTVEKVRERDVYREHIREVVRQGQEKVNAADKGQQMDPEIDAAVAAGLCGVHDSLCRRPRATPVQPVRQPVPGADRAR